MSKNVLRVLVAIASVAAIIPFLVTKDLVTNNIQHFSPVDGSSPWLQHTSAVFKEESNVPQSMYLQISSQNNYISKSNQEQDQVAVPIPLPRKCDPGVCAPRRYFATTNQHPPVFYLEPNLDPTGRHGMFSAIPSRPWDESSINYLDLYSQNAADLVRSTKEQRYSALLEADMQWNSLLPKLLPPQFPQWDRTIQRHIASSTATVLGIPPSCCPAISNHKMLTQNWSDANVLTEEQLNDCECRAPRNYPNETSNPYKGPIATIVTAFYQMNSKHPVKMYEKSASQLLGTSDPMIIFCEPNSKWVNFFQENRAHAPTIVVPLSAEQLTLKRRFPQETFWKKQYEIDPEGPTHHKGVNTMLYIIWDEKLILLHSAAMLNPFNTTAFAWVDTGYWRNPAPHLYRQSVFRINITKEGVNDGTTLMYQMHPDNPQRDVIIEGNSVLVGGNSFAGTYNGISRLYSAFYETFWAMATTGKFVGSDQKVIYRTCHTYPDVCHIHAPKKSRQWLGMLGELLPGVGGREKIKEPLELSEILVPLENLPLPPNGVVDDATAKSIWMGLENY